MHFKTLFGPFCLFIVIVLLISSYCPIEASKSFLLTGKAQGTTYSIKYVYSSEIVAQIEIDSLFKLFDQSMSVYNPHSLISQLNKTKRTASLDSHLLKIIDFSDSLSKASNNTFNITMLPLLELWGLKQRKITHYPDSNMIKLTLQKSVNKVMLVKDLSVSKSTKKLRIDVDGIAQGYCVDYLSNYLLSKGISNFIVEIGGEVFAIGTDQFGRKWRVGVQDGDYLMGNKEREDVVINLDKQGITTSGKYQKFSQIGDSTISHVLDPRTGYPVKNDLVSVTVLAKNAMLADGLDNAFMVMGVNETMKWLEKNPNIGVFMVYRKKDGSLADTANGFFRRQIAYSK